VDIKNDYFISICIPSYNRPEGLNRLLESIDSKQHMKDIQVVICEDNAPKRPEVSSVAEAYKKNSPYQVKYVENQINLGHGANWRQCSTQADGEFLLYMGDDDAFIPGALDPFIDWVKGHRELGYILRAYRRIEPKGKIQYHKYYGEDKFYGPGIIPYTEFFMKSILMSGYTIKREYANQFKESSLDSTLYFQMYLAAEVCLKYPSAYCNIPIAQLIGDGISYFGTNDVEKEQFTPGENAAGSIVCAQNMLKITNYLDEKYKFDSTKIIKMEMSKYSFPTLSLNRQYGIAHFNKSCREYRKIGLDESKYFSLYYIALLVFGAPFCDKIVQTIKKVVGRRLHL
jgi:abequosyltransferase